MPPNCVSRLPAFDSALITLVLTPFFAAIIISRFTRFFWRVPERYSSVSMRYSGWGLPGAWGYRMRFSASWSEKSTRLSVLLRRFSRISRRFSVSSVAFSSMSCLKALVFVRAATCGGELAEPVIWR